MAKKVKTAIFGKDQRVELKDYELSSSGNKISIVSGGEGYFMPKIGPTTFLDWPIRKKYLLFGEYVYKRIFFALKRGSSCIDFGNAEGILYGPDLEQLKLSNANFLATKLGKDRQEGIPWYTLVTLGLLVFIVLIQLGVI